MPGRERPACFRRDKQGKFRQMGIWAGPGKQVFEDPFPQDEHQYQRQGHLYPCAAGTAEKKQPQAEQDPDRAVVA